MVAVPNLSIATTVSTTGNDLRLQKNRTRLIELNSSLLTE